VTRTLINFSAFFYSITAGLTKLTSVAVVKLAKYTFRAKQQQQKKKRRRSR